MLLRSDPKLDRNVLFYDDQSALAGYIFGRMSEVTNTVRIRWHQIYPDQLAFLTIQGVEGEALPQNRFSLTASPRGYAIVVLDRALASGEWGDSGSVAQGCLMLNGYWKANIKDGRTPVKIAKGNIQGDSITYGYDPDRALEMTVVHELGHKLALRHSEIGLSHDPQPGLAAAPGMYRYNHPDSVYAWKHLYRWTAPDSGFVHEQVLEFWLLAGRGAMPRWDSPIVNSSPGFTFLSLQDLSGRPPETPVIQEVPYLTYAEYFDVFSPPRTAVLLDTSKRLWFEASRGYLMDPGFRQHYLHRFGTPMSQTFTAGDFKRMRSVPVCPPEPPQ
jgi:hypothetical protein